MVMVPRSRLASLDQLNVTSPRSESQGIAVDEGDNERESTHVMSDAMPMIVDDVSSIAAALDKELVQVRRPTFK